MPGVMRGSGIFGAVLERKRRSFVGRVKRLIFGRWLGAGAGGMNRPGPRPGLSEDDVGVHVAREAYARRVGGESRGMSRG